MLLGFLQFINQDLELFKCSFLLTTRQFICFLFEVSMLLERAEILMIFQY